MTTAANWPNMKKCLVGRLEESVKGGSRIHCLSDELLMEILRRLPDCQSVTQCKCVSKRWATLISNPWFIAQFVDLNYKHQTFGIIMWYKPDRYLSLWKGSESFFRPSIFKAQNSSFSPCPFHGDNNASVTLVASCKDLLLYCRHEKDKKYDYYMSNVQTKQWIELPSPPNYYGRLLHFGLICDPPFYSRDGENVLNVAYRYSVVVFRCPPRPSTKFTAHLFSSTNHCDSQWCDRVLSLPKTCTFFGPGSGFCFDGKLHFECREGIFGFDQNNIELDDEIKCHLIKWPIAIGNLRACYHVGYSQESLQVSRLYNGDTLCVWVLKDYKTSNWMLQHKLETCELVPRESWMKRKLEKFTRFRTARSFSALVNVLGFHPGSPDVIYVLVPGYIFLCNLSTKTMELACRIPAAVSQRCEHYLIMPYDIPVLLQSWPTSLPRLFSAVKMESTPLPPPA